MVYVYHCIGARVCTGGAKVKTAIRIAGLAATPTCSLSTAPAGQNHPPPSPSGASPSAATRVAATAAPLSRSARTRRRARARPTASPRRASCTLPSTPHPASRARTTCRATTTTTCFAVSRGLEPPSLARALKGRRLRPSCGTRWKGRRLRLASHARQADGTAQGATSAGGTC